MIIFKLIIYFTFLKKKKRKRKYHFFIILFFVVVLFKLCTNAGFCLCHPEWTGNACELAVVITNKSITITNDRNSSSSSSSSSSIVSSQSTIMNNMNPLSSEVIHWIWDYLEQMQKSYGNSRHFQLKRFSMLFFFFFCLFTFISCIQFSWYCMCMCRERERVGEYESYF